MSNGLLGIEKLDRAEIEAYLQRAKFFQTHGEGQFKKLDTLRGKTVGFISNGKEGTKGFFGHLDRVLREEYGVKNVVFRTKSNYSAPADPHIVAEIGQWDAVISGIGD